MMRVSSGMMMSKYMNQINSSYANQAKLMEQSDGSNLHRPSDNSVRYSRYLTYQNRDTENLQYQDNVKAGASWMKTADAAMVNMTDIYTTLKEKTVDAGNDTNNDSDLITAIAKEFRAKLYEMVSLGNNQQGDRYLFAGQSDLTQPFQVSTEEKDRGLIKVLDDPQTRFFKNPNDTKNLNADDTGSLTQFLEVNDKDGNRFFVNTQNGRIYSEDFLQSGYKDKIKEGVEYVEEGDEHAILPFFDTDALKVSGYFENTGVVRTEGKVSINDGDETTYSYGDQIWLTSSDTAKATVPVYIVDEYGNERVVAKGNEIKINQDKGEQAYVGVPLRATSYQQGTVYSLGSTLSYPQLDPTLSFNKGDSYTLDKYEYAVADADIQYTTGAGTTPVTVKAGEIIPAGVTINFLTDNTNIARDPKIVNNDTSQAQNVAYLNSLKSQLSSGAISNVSIVSDGPVSIQTPAVGGGYDYSTIPSGTDLTGYLQNATAIAIGDCQGTAAGFNGLSSANTANITVYFHDTFAVNEMQTGKPVKFEDENGNPVSTVTLPSADVMIKNENGDARIVKAGNPITLESGESEAIIIGKPQSVYHYDGFVTIKQPIVTYEGDAKYISMVKLNGTVDQTADTINATGQDLNGSNIFDDANSGNQIQIMSNGKLCYVSSGTAMINDMFTVCAKLDHGDRKWMRTDGITVADMAHEVITTAQSKTAARQNVYDSVQEMLTKQNEFITEDINKVSGTNIAELAVKLMEAQTIYNMALSMGGRILPPSLADYL